jgi:hypothetical protein
MVGDHVDGIRFWAVLSAGCQCFATETATRSDGVADDQYICDCSFIEWIWGSRPWESHSHWAATFGYPLGVVYLIWIGIVALLYPLCRRYAAYKKTHRQWWLSYI